MDSSDLKDLNLLRAGIRKKPMSSRRTISILIDFFTHPTTLIFFLRGVNPVQRKGLMMRIERKGSDESEART